MENYKGTLFSTQTLPLQNVKPGEHKLFLKILRVNKEEGHRLAVISLRLIPN
jgi:hypothetical protein